MSEAFRPEAIDTRRYPTHLTVLLVIRIQLLRFTHSVLTIAFVIHPLHRAKTILVDSSTHHQPCRCRPAFRIDTLTPPTRSPLPKKPKLQVHNSRQKHGPEQSRTLDANEPHTHATNASQNPLPSPPNTFIHMHHKTMQALSPLPAPTHLSSTKQSPHHPSILIPQAKTQTPTPPLPTRRDDKSHTRQIDMQPAPHPSSLRLSLCFPPRWNRYFTSVVCERGIHERG